MPSDTTQTRPAAPPPAGRPPALTRDQVLAAALQIIDEQGVEALTMRRLGQALDRNPMGIYRHAADKDALLDLVVEHVVAELVVPHERDRDGDGGGEDHVDWESALRRTAHAFRQVALAHPNVVPLLVNRSITGPLALRPLGTLHAARLFTGFLYGHVQDELQEQVHDPDETDDLLRLGLHRLPITQFPRLRSLATVLATYDGAAELDEGLAIVIAGLRSQLLT